MNYLVKRDLHDTSKLLSEWADSQFLNEFYRQVREHIGSFSLQQQRTWQDQTNFHIRSLLIDLRQSLEIIRLNEYINKLYKRVLGCFHWNLHT